MERRISEAVSSYYSVVVIKPTIRILQTRKKREKKRKRKRKRRRKEEARRMTTWRRWREYSLCIESHNDLQRVRKGLVPRSFEKCINLLLRRSILLLTSAASQGARSIPIPPLPLPISHSLSSTVHDATTYIVGSCMRTYSSNSVSTCVVTMAAMVRMIVCVLFASACGGVVDLPLWRQCVCG